MLKFVKDVLSPNKASQLDGLLHVTSHESSALDSVPSAKKQLHIRYTPFNCLVGFTLTPSFIHTSSLPLPRTMKSKDLVVDVFGESETMKWNVTRLPDAKYRLTASASGYLASKATMFWTLAVLLQPLPSPEWTLESDSGESDEERAFGQSLRSNFTKLKCRLSRPVPEKPLSPPGSGPVPLGQLFLEGCTEALNKFPPLQCYVHMRMASLVPSSHYLIDQAHLSDIQMLIFEDRLSRNVDCVVSSLLDLHLSKGHWQDALQLTESECFLNIHGEIPQPLDIVLAGLVSSARRNAKDSDSSEAVDVWKYVARMGNPELATTIALACLEEWSPDFCIDVLKMCRKRLESSSLIEVVDRKLDEMYIYHKVSICQRWLSILVISERM